MLRTLEVTALQLVTEVEPGVPLSVVGAGPAAGLRVITKAGAFGYGGDAAALPRPFEILSFPLKVKPMSLPRIAITMGDAAGVGPEVIVKSLAHAELYDDLPSGGDRRCRAPADRRWRSPA